MKKNFYYISESLPNSFSGGTAQLGINLLKELKNYYNVIAVNCMADFYASEDRFLKAKEELKKEKIDYFIIKDNVKRSKHHITFWNFFKTNYYEKEKINEIKSFIEKINITEDSIIFCVGSNTIYACNNINAHKIALFEDIQDQVQIYRTYLSINKFNFFKKIIKILMWKVYFRNYYKWLKNISSNFQIKYTYSPYDYSKLIKKVKVSVIPCPVNVNLESKNIHKKKFNISMFSFAISQDYNGVKLLYSKLLPKLKEKKLLDKVSLNLVMVIPKNIPFEIKKIVNDKNINVKNYGEDILRETDLLFYPSKYPVGVRSKILFAFSRSWFVATSNNIKKCIPELEDFKNCIMSNNINKLVNKILYLIQNEKQCDYIKKNGYNILSRYSPKIGANKIQTDLNNIYR